MAEITGVVDVTQLQRYQQNITDKKYVTGNISALKRGETLAAGNVRYVTGMASGYVVVCKTAGATAADTAPEYPATDKTDVTDGTAVLTVRYLLTEGGASTAEDVSYGDSNVKSALDDINQQLEDMNYKAIAINSFSNNVNTAERGSTVTAVNLSWAFSKTPASVTLNDEAQDVKSTGKNLTGQKITANTTWTLKATDERKATATKTTSITFKDKRYWGVGKPATDDIDSAFILTLNGAFADNLKGDYTVTAADGNYIYFAAPASWGTPSFWVGGFEGGFDLVKTLDFTNASGAVVSYNVFKSTNADLGDTTVTIK